MTDTAQPAASLPTERAEAFRAAWLSITGDTPLAHDERMGLEASVVDSPDLARAAAGMARSDSALNRSVTTSTPTQPHANGPVRLATSDDPPPASTRLPDVVREFLRQSEAGMRLLAHVEPDQIRLTDVVHTALTEHRCKVVSETNCTCGWRDPNVLPVGGFLRHQAYAIARAVAEWRVANDQDVMATPPTSA